MEFGGLRRSYAIVKSLCIVANGKFFTPFIAQLYELISERRLISLPLKLIKVKSLQRFHFDQK